MRTPLLPTVLAVLVVMAAPLRATEGGFTATLSKEQVASTGIAGLSADEQVALDALVAGEVALARQGDIKGFSGTFSSRRSAEERTTAGLDRLKQPELAELDGLVAALIAAGPVTRDIPVRLKRDQVSTKRDRLEVHGEISLTYGRGSGGRSFQGGSLSTIIFDKKTGTTIGFTYGQYDGDLFPYYGRYGDYYGGYYGDGPYGGRGVYSRGAGVRRSER